MAAVGNAATTIFTRGSSEIDWCEENYQYNEYIAEYYNTISNSTLVFIPLIMIYLSRPFSQYVNPDINIIWVLLALVGVGSGYFHATLSYTGQLIDEVSILWVLASCLPLLIPRSALDNRVFANSRLRLKIAVLIATLASSALLFAAPKINAFVLMLGAIPALARLFDLVISTHYWRAVRLIFISVFLWLLAITCWINDRFFCKIWTNASGIPYPQFHAFWHFLISVASYSAVIVGAYFVAAKERPELHPRLRYWPIDRLEFGIVYIGFSASDPITTMRKND